MSIKFLLDNFRIVRVGTTNERRRLLFNLRKEKEKLRLQGIEPTHQLMAEKLNVFDRRCARDRSGNRGGRRQPGQDLLRETTSSRYPSASVPRRRGVDDQLARGELKEAFDRHLAEFSANLSDRETAILRKRPDCRRTSYPTGPCRSLRRHQRGDSPQRKNP